MNNETDMSGVTLEAMRAWAQDVGLTFEDSQFVCWPAHGYWPGIASVGLSALLVAYDGKSRWFVYGDEGGWDVTGIGPKTGFQLEVEALWFLRKTAPLEVLQAEATARGWESKEEGTVWVQDGVAVLCRVLTNWWLTSEEGPPLVRFERGADAFRAALGTPGRVRVPRKPFSLETWRKTASPEELRQAAQTIEVYAEQAGMQAALTREKVGKFRSKLKGVEEQRERDEARHKGALHWLESLKEVGGP